MPNPEAGTWAGAESETGTDLKGWAEGWSRVRGWNRAEELDRRREPSQELETRQVSGPQNRKQGREVPNTSIHRLGVHAKKQKRSGTGTGEV